MNNETPNFHLFQLILSLHFLKTLKKYSTIIMNYYYNSNFDY